MGAIALLKEQHLVVKDLFEKFEAEPDAKERGRIVQELVKNLVIHAEIEEKIFYPRLQAASAELRELILEARQEHHLAKVEIAEIEGLTPETETCKPRVKVLKDVVLHHIAEEEGQVFALAEKACGLESLKELGTQLEAETERLKDKGTRLLVTMMRQEAREESKI